MTRVLICGGRDFADAELMARELERLHADRRFATVIEGGARGADSLAGEWADAHGIERRTFKAEWSKYRRAAGPKRNRRMLEEGRPDLVVAFAGGHGTAGMIALARAAGVDVIEVTPPG